MATLAALLASLTNPDGSPDIKARRQQLNSLMSQLLSSELRHIKDHLCALTWTMDFIPKLPVEIVMCISEYMTLTDFSIIQMVSKSWLTCFTRSDIIDRFARKHFSMAYETSLKTAMPSARLKMFNALSCRTRAINLGNYCSMACFSYDSSDHLESIRCFNENQVAWTSNEMIFVRNLVSGETKRFVTPERHRITGLCMREDYLLAGCASSTLHVWSIAKGEMHKIRLPAIPLFFDTNHGNVLVSLNDGSVLKWAIGQSVQQLNIPVLPKESTIFLGCDPLSKDTFIRCSMQLVNTTINETARSESLRKTLRFLAEKFTNECILSRSAVDLALTEQGRIVFEHRPFETIHKMRKNSIGLDENGHYSAIVLSKFIKTETCACCQDLVSYCYPCSRSFLRVYYSAVEGRWRKNTYAAPDGTMLEEVTGPAAISSFHFIKNRALVPVIPIEDPCYATNDLFVVGIEAYDEEETSQYQTTTKLRCISGSDGNSITERPLTIDGITERKGDSVTYNAGLRYALAKEAGSRAITLRVNLRDSHRLGSRFQICGDSTFMIIFGTAGYIVWCYDKNITLSQSSDEERRILEFWPTRPFA